MAEPTEKTPTAPPPADGVSEAAAASPPVATSRGFRFLGEDKSVHKALGGGKTADVLLWKDKKMSAAVIGGATVIWVLFEVVEYNFMPLVSHFLIGALAVVFLWSKATIFIKKSSPDIPEVQISEELAANIVKVLRTDINQALRLLREIAMGHDLMKFIGVYFYPNNLFLFHFNKTSLSYPVLMCFS
uniref:Uncharacterized protein n=1 Tax=Avena sativa TaxID=4498 RepID=A0ACD5YPP4_AVESA